VDSKALMTYIRLYYLLKSEQSILCLYYYITYIRTPLFYLFFFGQFLIYSKPIKVKDEMFYVTFKLQTTCSAYNIMTVCVEF
jgi:hypothetical protein